MKSTRERINIRVDEVEEKILELKDRKFASNHMYPTICCLQKIHFGFKDTHRLKVKG